MRLALYALVTSIVFLILFGFGQPIDVWLKGRKLEADRTARQAVITKADQSVAFIKGTLVLAVNAIPSVSRVRVALIHAAISPLGESIIQWNVVAMAASVGHVAGLAEINQPLTQWSDFLGSLLQHECVFEPVTSLKDHAMQQRLAELKVAAFVGCPIFNKNRQFLGAIFSSWDDMLDVPKDLEPVKRVLRLSAQVIGEASH